MNREYSDTIFINLKRMTLVVTLVFIAFVLSFMGTFLCWFPAITALFLSIRYAIVSLKCGQHFVSVFFLGLFVVQIGLLAVPIWGGHRGWVSYHHHYLWEVGHMH